MKSLLFIFFLLFSSLSFADQLAWIQEDQAKKATEFLKTQKQIMIHCGCCDDHNTTLLNVEKVYYIETEVEGLYQVIVEGTTTDGRFIKEELDLAYTYFKKGKKPVCVGKHLKFECDPCEKPKSWNQ